MQPLKDIVPLRSRSLAGGQHTEGNRALPVSVKSVPKPLIQRVVALRLAFQAGAAPAQDDRTTVLQLYCEGMAGFPIAVADYALRHLLLHNPRNPFPPTPQDLFELCKKVRNQWSNRVTNQFLGTEDARWGAKNFEGDDVRKLIDWGPAPFEPGCYVPDDLVISILREALASKFYFERLADLEPERFEQFPSDAYDPGQLDVVLGMRAERAEKAGAERRVREEQRQHEEYLSNLGYALQWAREDVLHQSMRDGEILSEDEVIEKAKARIAARRRAAGLENMEAAR